MSVRTVFRSQRVPVGSSPVYTASLKDEDGAAIAASALDTLTLTLYTPTPDGPAIVNSVEEVDILNTGRGTLSEAGELAVAFLPEDTALLNTDRRSERRIAQIVASWNSGVGRLPHEVEFIVQAFGWP